jgi:hypothetical protein
LTQNGVITIATSLAPGKKLDEQRKVINSWCKMGFKCVSINAPDEIAILEKDFPDIEFVVAVRDARKEFGKPYIYFDDFLAYFAGSDSQICGIVNSDIYLMGEIFHSFISKEAVNSLLYGSRIDIKTLDNLQGKLYQWGFDYFFFDRKLIHYYPNSDFCIGLPWWDYWIILVAILCEIPVKKVTDMLAYHVKHKNGWNKDSCLLLKDAMLMYVKPINNGVKRNYVEHILEFIRENSIDVSLN